MYLASTICQDTMGRCALKQQSESRKKLIVEPENRASYLGKGALEDGEGKFQNRSPVSGAHPV